MKKTETLKKEEKMLNSLFSIVIDLRISTFLFPVGWKFSYCFENYFSLFCQ